MKKENPFKTGAIYVRVSTGRQDEHELSPDSQIKLALDYAEKNQISVPEEYIFHEKGGVSGKHADKRPYFQQMIGLAKSPEHPIDIILVWKFSRFARNQEESIVYKTMLRKNCGVEVVSISEPLVEGPFGSLIERIIEWMDEYYVIRLSGEVSRGMAENALRGNYQARPPLGYRIEHKGEPPVIVPEEAGIVQMIFQKYVYDKLSLLEICRQLNAMGLRTSRGKEFEKRSLTYILQNISYTGKIRWNRTESETHRVKPEEEWIVAQGKQPAIISQELFDLAQKRFREEYTPKHQKPPSSVTHWLGGILKCSACGRTLSASRHTDKRYGHTYCHFQCCGYLKGKCQVSHSISEKKILPWILQAFKKVLDTTELAFAPARPVRSDRQPERELLIRALEKNAQKEIRAKKAYLDEIDTLEEYKENKELLRKERAELEKRLEKLDTPDTSRKEIPGRIGTKSAGILDDSDTAGPKMRMDQNIDKTKTQAVISSACGLLLDDSFPTASKNEAVKSVLEKIIYHKTENRITLYFYYS